jgi:hypothetical protein
MDRAVPWLSRSWVAIALDILLVLAVYLGTLLLRFDGAVPGEYLSGFWASIPFIATTYVVIGLLARSYSPGAPLVRVGAVALASGLMVAAAGTLTVRPLPLSVMFLGALGSAIGLAGVRLLGRPLR